MLTNHCHIRRAAGVYVAATRAAPVLVNGAPALRLELDDALEAVVTFAVTQGRVTAAYIVRSPHKLHAVEQETVLTR